MKHFEASTGKNLITWIVFGVVGLLILGALSSGPGAWTYYLANVNTTSTIVQLIAGTVIVILFFVAVALKFL